MRKGNITISSQNMMPIIKKWLYSDKDIFLRELVSNASDAITKHIKLANMGETQKRDNYFIKISTDSKKKTLTIEDNGIGMTEEEIEKYITNVAFSGASDFIEKYEKAGGDGIIGYFGLGFYSAYMVAQNIIIQTRSYTGAKAVEWQSDGNSEYTISDCDRQEFGTKIILELAPEEKEFAKDTRIRELINKYCKFMPYEIYLNAKGTSDDKPLNNTAPLYTKKPSECSDQDYISFYQETFFDYSEPLFWIHLNMDYPFKLQGILYFPKQKNNIEITQGEVKLFCNQVFIADNIKEVIPEFLMLLKGVIDCPDIPLNVSRSFLQNDGQVQKISKHIVKKVSDKLNSLYKNDIEKYKSSYEDISVFIKYGAIKENGFYDKIKDILIFKDLDNNYNTLKEIAGDGGDIYYVSDKDKQSQYIKMFKDANIKTILLSQYIDPHFISFLEQKQTNYKFKRIDSEIDASLKGQDDAATSENLINIFKENLTNKDINVAAQSLLNQSVPAIINVPEFMRRFKEMNAQFIGEVENSDKDLTLVINTSNPLVKALVELEDANKKSLIVNHIYYMAAMSHSALKASELSAFIEILCCCLKAINKTNWGSNVKY